MAVTVTFGTPELKGAKKNVGVVPATSGNKTISLKYWVSDSFSSKIIEGATAEVEIEPKTTDYGDENWIKTLDGEGARGGNRGGGGGGRSNYQPKTPLEIHSSCVAGVIKSCLDNSIIEPAKINAILDQCYWAQMEKAK